MHFGYFQNIVEFKVGDQPSTLYGMLMQKGRADLSMKLSFHFITVSKLI